MLGAVPCSWPMATEPRPALLVTSTQTAAEIPSNQSRHAEQDRHPAALSLFLDAGIEQHDDENEQHHHRSRVDDDLNGGNELGAEQQINQSAASP